MSKKKLVVLSCIGMMAMYAIAPMSVSAEAFNTYEPGEEYNLGARAVQYEWRYKIENGKMYRRLWDRTNGKWLTDWILC